MAMHDLIRELENRPQWALARPKYRTTRVAEAWLDHVETTGVRDPIWLLEHARTALRLTKIIGFRCQRARAVSLYAGALRMLGRLESCERCLVAAFRISKGCNHCAPHLHRMLSFLLIEQGRAQAAFENAETALGLYEERADAEGIGKALVARGMAYVALERVDLAILDMRRALDLTPLDAKVARDVTLHAYARVLALSQDPGHNTEALAAVPGLRDLNTSLAIYIKWRRHEQIHFMNTGQP